MDPLTGILISAGINAAMGAARAAQAAKQRQTEANIRAAEIEASPWTNKAASTQISTPSPSVWADMLGGAVSGIGQAQAFQKAGLFNPESQASTGMALSQGTVAPQNLSPEDYFAQSQPDGMTWSRMLPGQYTLMGRR